MPTRTHLAAVARAVKNQLGDRAFLTLERSVITGMLRQVSGEPKTRLSSRLAQELTRILCFEGIQVYPDLATTATHDTIRLYRAGTVMANLTDAIANPDSGNDWYLADVLTKIKGKWRWPEAS